jgi:hypothetical protein
MKKVYLFIYNDETGTREELKAIISIMNTVLTWRFDMPHSFYIISENSAIELYDEFTKAHGIKGRYMFIECTDNKQGQMLPDTWYLLNNKQLKPKS